MVEPRPYIEITLLLATLLISMQLFKVALRIALKGVPGDGLTIPSWSIHHPGTSTSATKARSTSAATRTTRISPTATAFAASTTTTNTFSASTTTNTFASFHLSLNKSLYVYIAMYYFLLALVWSQFSNIYREEV
ncbi:hypothetical protein AMTRI_Chr10g4540 [Amborella trichopoda]